jgi:hypothetical protein
MGSSRLRKATRLLEEGCRALGYLIPTYMWLRPWTVILSILWASEPTRGVFCFVVLFF